MLCPPCTAPAPRSSAGRLWERSGRAGRALLRVVCTPCTGGPTGQGACTAFSAPRAPGRFLPPLIPPVPPFRSQGCPCSATGERTDARASPGYLGAGRGAILASTSSSLEAPPFRQTNSVEGVLRVPAESQLGHCLKASQANLPRYRSQEKGQRGGEPESFGEPYPQYVSAPGDPLKRA